MNLADTASRLLAKHGEPIAFQYTIAGKYDVATGDVPPAKVVDIIGNGYPSAYKQNLVNGKSIIAGDVRLICEKLSERPEQNWQCTVDSEVYAVKDVQPIRKSGGDIIYIIQLRK